MDEVSSVPKGTPAGPAKEIVRFGAFEVDRRAGELRKGGVKIKLHGQPFQVLAMLLERPDEVVTREELHKRLWSAETFVDFEQGLNNAIMRLREALNDSADAPRFIETMPRLGYRFIAPVVEPGRSPGRSIDADQIERASTKVTTGYRSWRTLRGFWLGATAVGFIAALIFGLRLDRQRFFGTAASPRIHALAVLPLENLSGDPSQEYFADGITDALTTNLAQVSAFQVISRTSAMQYKGAKKSLPEIARELNVDAVVEGTVVRREGHVLVNTQLIDARTDRHLWARAYDRDLADASALQSEVAGDIVHAMQVQLTPKEQARLARSQRTNSEAYDLYLRALVHVGLENRQDNQAAVELLEQAVARDPKFAPAYAALGREYRTKAFIVDPKGKQWEEKAFAASVSVETSPPFFEDVNRAKPSHKRFSGRRSFSSDIWSAKKIGL